MTPPTDARASVSSLRPDRAQLETEEPALPAPASVPDTGTNAPADRPEPWVTKRQLAKHLQVTPRWIEMQQRLGLPRLQTPGLNRYRISEVEAWLRYHYGSRISEAA
jgi:hypothetical protein